MLHDHSLQVIKNFFSQYKIVRYKRRDVILQAADINEKVFFIKQGYARAYKISEQGEELTLVILKPQDFFPLNLESYDTSSHYYLEALTPLEILQVPREEFLNILRSNPTLFYDLITHLSHRFGGLLTRLEYMVFGNAYTKVATTLVACGRRFGEEHEGNIILDLPLTHKDIATLIGITRETTCLEMKKLERKGLISYRGRMVVITNMKKLEEESTVTSDQELFLNNSF